MIDLASLRGKVVVVTVISTWAGPALIETELYRALHQRYGGKLEIVTIVMERPEMVQIFQKQFALPYLVGWVDDPAALSSADGPFGEITLIPTSILLDREGRIAARMDGTWAPAVLEEAIQRLLAP